MSDGAKIGIGLVAAYIGFFLVIILDELVLETDYLENYIPESVAGVLQVIYLPLIPAYVWLQEIL